MYEPETRTKSNHIVAVYNVFYYLHITSAESSRYCFPSVCVSVCACLSAKYLETEIYLFITWYEYIYGEPKM